MAKQGKVNVQLNLLNRYIEGVKSYFPIENVEKLMELEQKMADNEGIKAAVVSMHDIYNVPPLF